MGQQFCSFTSDFKHQTDDIALYITNGDRAAQCLSGDKYLNKLSGFCQ